MHVLSWKSMIDCTERNARKNKSPPHLFNCSKWQSAMVLFAFGFLGFFFESAVFYVTCSLYYWNFCPPWVLPLQLCIQYCTLEAVSNQCLHCCCHMLSFIICFMYKAHGIYHIHMCTYTHIHIWETQLKKGYTWNSLEIYDCPSRGEPWEKRVSSPAS